MANIVTRSSNVTRDEEARLEAVEGEALLLGARDARRVRERRRVHPLAAAHVGALQHVMPLTITMR